MRSRSPDLVLVVDETRLAADDFLPRLAQLLEAGLPAVWLRAGALPAGPFLELAQRAREATSARGAELWIGDRADVARLSAADRLHLPGRGLPAGRARGLLPLGTRVGRSVHGGAAARSAAEEGVDHLVVGTIFASASHPGGRPAGPRRIRTVVQALAGRTAPTLYAIGGLEPGRVAAVRAAGAHGVVAQRALWDAPRPAAATEAFLAALGAAPPAASTLNG